MKYILLYIPFLILPFFSSGQLKLFTKTAVISFSSKSPLENIEARNKNVLSVWDVNTGRVEFSLLMREFEFKKALMQEHFNEDYVESDKYPKAFFKGVIDGGNTLSTEADGIYNVTINGTLTLHGVQRQISAPVTITIKNKTVSAKSEFTVALADFNIKIPAIVANNISKQIKVQVYIAEYKPLANR
ncbi:MAG: YceI family protein [Ginsengibacter sp.]